MNPAICRIQITLFWIWTWVAKVNSYNRTCYTMNSLLNAQACFFFFVYIYIYIYNIYTHTNFIKHNRHFMSTYFLLDPFEFLYYFYRIRGELVYVLSIVVCIPSTFGPTLGHHQGRIYYKSDVTFVLAYYHYVRASLPLKDYIVVIC